jgi:hypothetical protein
MFDEYGFCFIESFFLNKDKLKISKAFILLKTFCKNKFYLKICGRKHNYSRGRLMGSLWDREKLIPITD